MINAYSYKIDAWQTENKGKSITLLLSAGFEDRARAAALFFGKGRKLVPSYAIVLDYEDLETNEPNRSAVMKTVRRSFSTVEVIRLSKIEKAVSLCDERRMKGDVILVDISAMSRTLIFKVLNSLVSSNIPFQVVYTEAEKYYPNQGFYKKLKSVYEKEETKLLTEYQKLEQSEVIYSYDCEVDLPHEFQGRPEPGRPSVLIAFLTFKRSRLQTILRAFEFSNRILIVGEPVREDLRWRKELLELINYDLIKKRLTDIKTLFTLDPFSISRKLEEYLEDQTLRKSNIYLAPLGSKMQTVGAFLFWRRHPEISIVFSQPKRYFRDKFSRNSRDTFVVTYDKLVEAIKTS
jgi:hypothetical protein